MPHNPNQCDGCKAQMPLDNGIHYAYTAKGKIVVHQVCQADKYPPVLKTQNSP